MSRHTRSSYRQTVLRFRKRRYLVVRGILPQAILNYLKVYYSILMANDKLQKDSQCPSSLALRGRSRSGCRIRMDSAKGNPLGWVRSGANLFLYAAVRER